MKTPSIAILVPTCDKYISICEISLCLLNKFWNDHPPVFISGVKKISGNETLPFSSDPKDWIGITHEAVTQLQANGFEFCYLLLDDHPPVSKCNSEFLNKTLPLNANELNAAWISLVGWDQFRPSDGVVLSKKMLYLMRNSPNYKWNLNLHPGFWSVSGLSSLLKGMKQTYPNGGSARDFESFARSVNSFEIATIRKSLYRVSGDHYAVNDTWYKLKSVRRTLLFLIHLSRFSASRASRQLLEKIDDRLKVYTEYLNGPYPMIWSGLMQNGSVNKMVEKFIDLFGDKELSQCIKSIDILRGQDN